jgi:hypothetical protein
MQFVDTAGMFPYNDFWSVTDYISTTIFAIDMLFKVDALRTMLWEQSV